MALLYIPVGRTSCGWTPVSMMDGTGFTYVNKEGKLMPYRFAEAAPFDNDVAIVKTKDAAEGKNYTYVNASEVLCSLRFTDVFPFLESESRAYIDDEKYYVTKDLVCYKFANDLIENLKLADPNSDAPKLRLSKSGKTLELKFNVIGKATGKMLPIKMRDGSGCTYLDLNTMKILENRFKEVNGFWKGVALVRGFEDEIFFIDTKGCEYDKETVDEALTRRFCNELKQAKENGTLGKLLKDRGLPADYLDHIEDWDNLEEYFIDDEEDDDEEEYEQE